MKPPKKIWIEPDDLMHKVRDYEPHEDIICTPYALVTGFVKEVQVHPNKDGSFSFRFIHKNGRKANHRYNEKRMAKRYAQKFADALGCGVREVEK